LHIFAAKFARLVSEAVKAVINRRFRRSSHLLMRRALFFALVFLCHALALAALSSCVKLPRRAPVVNSLTTSELTQTRADAPTSVTLININTASREELERLPGIGRGLAARIVEHRERHGAFRRVEHLIIVRGISERRFAELRPFVTVD
jgi:competence ComEA-like helix-hairpin-helix protein